MKSNKKPIKKVVPEEPQSIDFTKTAEYFSNVWKDTRPLTDTLLENIEDEIPKTVFQTLRKTPPTRFNTYITPSIDDRDEEEYYEPNIINNNKGFENIKLLELLESYRNTKNIDYIYRLLFLSNYLSITSNCMINYDKEIKTKADPRIYIEGRIARDVENLLYSFAKLKININQEEAEKIYDIIKSFYDIYNNDKCFIIYITNKELYEDILKEFTLKNISIDSDFLNLKDINFKELRSNNKAILLVYLPFLNRLLFITDYYSYYSQDSHTYMFNYLDTLPNINKLNEKEINEIVNINGINYEKKVFESAVESSFEDFLNNLEIETILYKSKEIAENVVGIDFTNAL